MDPIGPSVERWRAMSEAEKDHFYQQIHDALHTPVETMSQGRPHNRARSAALDALLLHFKGQQAAAIGFLNGPRPR